LIFWNWVSHDFKMFGFWGKKKTKLIHIFFVFAVVTLLF
jgi:hypothetical protein